MCVLWCGVVGGAWLGAVAADPTELTCPSQNRDYNALWPSGVPAGTFVSGGYCAAGWTGTIGRQCQMNGQWAPTAVGGCTRKDDGWAG